MTAALAAAVVVIAIVVVIDFLLSLAIIRRLRAQGPITRPTIGLPHKGMSIPQFRMKSIAGEEIDTAWVQRQGALLLGFFAQSCPACSRLKNELRRSPPSEPLVSFLREPEEHEVVDVELRDVLAALGELIPFDSSTELTHRFEVNGFPTLIRVEDGEVVAAGHDLRAVGTGNGRSLGAAPQRVVA
jgi:thiol-disulfide isomerase/thioredoxin